MPESWEKQIIEFATDALELHGLSQVSLCFTFHSQMRWLISNDG